MMQGCLGPQNDASFEGPMMILGVGDFNRFQPLNFEGVRTK